MSKKNSSKNNDIAYKRISEINSWHVAKKKKQVKSNFKNSGLILIFLFY